MRYVRKELDIKKAIHSSKKYIIASSAMFIVCLIIGIIVKSDFLSVAIKVLSGMVVYLLMLIILGESYVYEIRDIVFAKLKRK